MKSLTPDEFFKQVSINAGIADLQTIKNIYYGMIRTMSRELRNIQTIRLPDWGDFKLKIHKSRNFISVRGKPGVLPPKPTIKFVPDRKVKEYFYALGEDGTVVK